MAVGLGQTVVDDEAVAVLYQRMPHEAELGFLARPLAVKPRLRIGRRSMRLVGALLTMEIRLAVPPSARRRRFVRSVCQGPHRSVAGPRVEEPGDQGSRQRVLSGALARHRSRFLASGVRADYARLAPSALACFEDDFEACIAHLRLPVTHRRLTRTTNLARTAVRRGAPAAEDHPQRLRRIASAQAFSVGAMSI